MESRSFKPIIKNWEIKIAKLKIQGPNAPIPYNSMD